MTEQQDVLDPQRPRRRRTPVILLGLLPAAIAATVLVAGPHYVDPTLKTTDASGPGTVVAAGAQITPGVIAPLTTVNPNSSVQQITVTLPKPKAAAPAAKIVTVKPATAVAKAVTKAPVNKLVKKAPAKKAEKKTPAKKAPKKSPKKASGSYKAFCADPSNPVSASGSTGKSLLGAVNKERAKLGIAPLRWSSSMASKATAWSQKMLKRDEATDELIDGLAHNPNRPGAENVAVVYSSGGYSGATAVKKMHKNLVYSNGHCLNLMNPNYSSMGAGIAHSDDGNTWYATENFR